MTCLAAKLFDPVCMSLAKKIHRCCWGAEQMVACAQTQEQGAPLAPAEMYLNTYKQIACRIVQSRNNNCKQIISAPSIH